MHQESTLIVAGTKHLVKVCYKFQLMAYLYKIIISKWQSSESGLSVTVDQSIFKKEDEQSKWNNPSVIEPES